MIQVLESRFIVIDRSGRIAVNWRGSYSGADGWIIQVLDADLSGIADVNRLP
jgi:hypothetical protein